MTLKVTFDDPSSGWVKLTILHGDDAQRIVGSYTPTDSFLSLVNALHAML